MSETLWFLFGMYATAHIIWAIAFNKTDGSI